MAKTSARYEPRWDEIIKSGRGYRPRRRMPRGVGRVVTYVVLFILILAVLGTGVYAYVSVKLRPGGSQEIAGLQSKKSKEPMNVLVLGSDSREGLSPEELKRYDPEGVDRKTGKRADTIILLHIDEKRDKAVLIHFPRDLRVTYPNGKPGKVNGAYQKGPGEMVETVKKFTGLPIHHYVEVNFSGFNNMVDILGGVKVQFARAIKEPDSGLNVPKGCVNLEGDQALAFVRVRKIDSDFGRIERQQLFVKLMMDKLTKAGTLLNPVKVVRLVNQFSENVKTDADLNVNEMKTLALRLRGFNSGKVDMRVVPSAGARIKGVSYVIANDKQTKLLFSAMQEREPLPDYGRTGVSSLEPADVRVTVLNSTGVPDTAKKEADVLTAAGFPAPPTGNASPHNKTTVYYEEGNEEKAQMIASRYGADMKIKPESIKVDTELALVLGADYAQGKATPPPPPPPGKSKPAEPAVKPLVSAC